MARKRWNKKRYMQGIIMQRNLQVYWGRRKIRHHVMFMAQSKSAVIVQAQLRRVAVGKRVMALCIERI